MKKIIIIAVGVLSLTGCGPTSDYYNLDVFYAQFRNCINTMPPMRNSGSIDSYVENCKQNAWSAAWKN